MGEKRNRPQLSCTYCKERKLKCDRAKPCQTCCKRGQADSCVYLSGRRGHGTGREKAKERVARLEGVVMSLYRQANSEIPLTDQASETIQDVGRQKTNQLEEPAPQPTSTVSPPNPPSQALSNWESILEDITEIKDYFEEHELDFQIDLQRFQPFAVGDDLTKGIHGFISSLPEKSEVDRLIAGYFESIHLYRPVIHPRQFQREYAHFWRAPSAVSKAWLGLLFAMLRLSAESRTKGPNSSVFEAIDEKISLFRKCALQCLDLDGTDKGNMHVLQGLLTHLEAEYVQAVDSKSGIWVLTGTAMRVAMMNGLHRDPIHFSEISPFESEIRRRLWMCVVHCDKLSSFQMGLPALFPEVQCDTALPRNLRDEDVDESTMELPPPRPLDGGTNLAFFLAKTPLVDVFAQIAVYLQTVDANEEAWHKLDVDLETARDTVPPYYRVRPMDESLTDPGYVVMRRFAVEQIYLTGVCVLHRRRLAMSRTNARFGPSRKKCIDAALLLLEFQVAAHHETRPSGRLAGLGQMMYSITSNDYLLAAMVICLDLHVGAKEQTSISDDASLWGRSRTDEMLRALEATYHVWKEMSSESAESLKASEALAAMLAKASPEFGITTKYGSSEGISSGLSTISSAQPTNDTPPLPSDIAASHIFTGLDDIDWQSELDRYISNPGIVDNWIDTPHTWSDIPTWQDSAF